MDQRRLHRYERSPQAMELLIVDDHPLYAHALCDGIRALDTGISTHVALDYHSAIAALKTRTFNFVIADLSIPGIDSVLWPCDLQSQFGIPVAIVSATDSPEVVKQIRARGLAGFIYKRTPIYELFPNLILVLSGVRVFPVARSRSNRAAVRKMKLTKRETLVMQLVADGGQNKTIARQLSVDVSTVKSHLQNVYQKLQVNSRAGAVASARRHGLLDDGM
jgi:DNA-binding NarL/FixJ family response regulator